VGGGGLDSVVDMVLIFNHGPAMPGLQGKDRPLSCVACSPQCRHPLRRGAWQERHIGVATAGAAMELQ
jgi:hypothetical protein